MISTVQCELSFGVVCSWRLVIHIDHTWWERPLLRVTAVKKSLGAGGISLKLTYICLYDESVFRLHLCNKEQANKRVALGVILHGRGDGL